MLYVSEYRKLRNYLLLLGRGERSIIAKPSIAQEVRTTMSIGDDNVSDKVNDLEDRTTWPLILDERLLIRE
jgi:hypothetical protein